MGGGAVLIGIAVFMLYSAVTGGSLLSNVEYNAAGRVSAGVAGIFVLYSGVAIVVMARRHRRWLDERLKRTEESETPPRIDYGEDD